MTLKPPNYTQIPNAILDLMPDMEESELRVVLVIARQTFGWHRASDQISVTQLMARTGMARQTVLNGVQAAIARGLVERTPARHKTFCYRLLIDTPDSEPVSPVDRSNDETGLTSGPEPVYSLDREPVYSLDRQKKDIKKGNKGGESDAHAPSASPPPPDGDSISSIYEEIFERTLSGYERAYLAARVTDPGQWRRSCEDWKVGGWKVTNLSGLVDRYSKSRDAPTATTGRDSPRRGPPVGEPVHETEAQIKIRCAARKAELLKGLPAWA